MEHNTHNMHNTYNIQGDPAVQAIQEIQSNLREIRPQPGSFFIGHFDGKDRYLRFDLNAFAELEERYGSMDKVEEIMGGGSMKDLRTLLWVGLLHEGAVIDQDTGEVLRYNITQYQVGSWITTQNMSALMDAINSAVSAATPTQEQTAPSLALATPAHITEAPSYPAPTDPTLVAQGHGGAGTGDQPIGEIPNL